MLFCYRWKHTICCRNCHMATHDIDFLLKTDVIQCKSTELNPTVPNICYNSL